MKLNNILLFIAILFFILAIVCILFMVINLYKIYKYNYMTKIYKTASYCGTSEKVTIKNNRKKKK